jgi:hypothetical protein
MFYKYGRVNIEVSQLKSNNHFEDLPICIGTSMSL